MPRFHAAQPESHLSARKLPYSGAHTICVNRKYRKSKEPQMFTSPLDFCPHCRQYVALNRTHAECAGDHHCSALSCPLQEYFEAGVSKPMTEPAPGVEIEPKHCVAAR
jgi:hypothetical protein